MVVVGLTGGIASGKSTVSNYLKKMGAAIIDADLLARQVVEPGEKPWQKIKEDFGNQVLNPNGTLNRKRLAEIIFNDGERRKALNEIIHPEVIKKTLEMIDLYKKEGQVPLIVIDAPLLIEAGMDTLVDEIWIVVINEELQVQRLMARDNISREGALQRLRAQIPTKDKLKYAHRIIDNSLNLEHTLNQVQNFWHQVVGSKECKK